MITNLKCTCHLCINKNYMQNYKAYEGGIQLETGSEWKKGMTKD